MMSETLKLATALSKDNATQLTHLLQSVQGFTSAAFVPAQNQIQITYDEDRTSLQELETVIDQAGYELVREQRRSDAGCCGGCCS